MDSWPGRWYGYFEDFNGRDSRAPDSDRETQDQEEANDE